MGKYKETLKYSIAAGTALAQAEQVEPSRGQIPADRALFSGSINKKFQKINKIFR